MKITDLELEQYGIYQNESWKPAAGCLNVIMGENESGKTTLLRFIRDMMFGYERGKWQGKKGNMGFLRADGSAYRIYRDGKNKWAVNDKGEEFNDELSSLWWHGLNRGIYEKIFAVGLEDLQGTSFLADDSVRSRFFMLQGGDGTPVRTGKRFFYTPEEAGSVEKRNRQDENFSGCRSGNG